MAFDGIAISCIKSELEKLLINGRVDKILQPEYDEISIVIRAGGNNHRLIVSASSSSPRVHLTSVQKENPEKPPMFCMLLRKHLTSGKIVGFSQTDFERMLQIHIEARDELGDISIKTLIIEIMGRHSNIILTDGQNKILGSIKHVDFSVSSLRQLIPGMLYEMPPSQGKLNPIETSKEEISAASEKSEENADGFILNAFTGIGPLTAREIAFICFNDYSTNLSLLTHSEKQSFVDFIYQYFIKIKNEEYYPVLLYKKEDKIWDFSAVDITQYQGKIIVKARDSLNNAADEFFKTRDMQERMNQKTSDLVKFIENNLQRCRKKLALQYQKLKDCENKESDKMYGDLLTTNLFKIQPKSNFIEVENYYDDMNIIRISLKPELSPSQNAQRYYKIYQKSKNAEVMTTKQIQLAENELEYLESVLESLQRAQNEKDVGEIRDELSAEGYLVKKKVTSKIRKIQASAPHKFTILDGFEVYVGKNNVQNDELTLRTANSTDLWLHTKNIPGSHTIIKTKGITPSDDVIAEAAKICAFFSKAKNSANVPVDYTIVKNVKKPNGAKPGMVIYDNYNTVNVKPTCPESMQ